MNNNININDFGVLLADSAKDILGDGYSVECKEVIKNNGVAYHAVVIRKNSGNIAPTIYIDEYYREYLKGKKVTAITDHVIKLYHESEVRGDFDVEFFTDFSSRNLVADIFSDSEKIFCHRHITIQQQEIRRQRYSQSFISILKTVELTGTIKQVCNLIHKYSTFVPI